VGEYTDIDIVVQLWWFAFCGFCWVLVGWMVCCFYFVFTLRGCTTRNVFI